MPRSSALRGSLPRYGINGIVFTALGLALFWLLYPMGAITAWTITESSCHILRYLSFRHIVFRRDHGYTVSPLRYFAAAAPTSLIGLAVVTVLKTALERNALVATSTAITTTSGYLINRYFYRKQ